MLPYLSDAELLNEDDLPVLGFSTYDTVEKLRRHDQLILLDKGDAAANEWMRDRGYGADGEPLKRKAKEVA